MNVRSCITGGITMQGQNISDSKEPLLKCRHVIAFIGFLLFLLTSIHRSIMSVAIIAMVNNTAIRQLSEEESQSCMSLIMNETENFHSIKKEGEFIWSPQTQGYVLGSVFFGSVITPIPSGILAEKYGCKWLLFSFSVLTGLFTLLIPPISRLSVWALIACQTLRGLALGLAPPSLAILAANWFPKAERGFLFTFMLSATPLGSAVGSIFTGYMCDLPEGWSYSFYAVGAATVTMSITILFLVSENPTVHPKISKAELHYILSNQENTLSRNRPKTPWWNILTSIPVYAFVFAYFGHAWAMSQYLVVYSTFLGTILHYPIAEDGLLTAGTFLVQFSCMQITSWISFYLEKYNVASADFLRKFWTFASGLGFSGCLIGVYLAGCHRTLSITFSIMSTGFIGFGAPSIIAVSTNMSPTFAGTLQSLSTTIAFMPMFILPVIVGYLTDGMQTIEQWDKVFFITIAVFSLSKIFFGIFGSSEIQTWNFVEDNTQHKDENCKQNDEKCQSTEMTRF